MGMLIRSQQKSTQGRRRFFSIILVIGVIASGIISCTPKQRYDRMVKRELAKGVRVDSLFLGLKLGMSTRAFYSQCWELNRLGEVRQGLNNTTVFYPLKDLKYPAEMNFYPNFIDDRISEMPVRINYKDWAPWQRHLFSDSLQLDVLRLLERWYGKGFIEVRNRHGNVTYVKVDGNRQISIYKNDDDHIWILYKDLTALEALQEEGRPEDNL